MKLSIYTFVRNGIYLDYHVVEMLKHHLELADEIIVNEGYSSDKTFEKISNIDPKIKIFRSRWEKSEDVNWYVRFKDEARRKCTGDWCILLDCDEFIPEWEFDEIRSYLTAAKKDMVPVRLINFYGNYKVYHSKPEKVSWPSEKVVIHRNTDDVEVWGDGSNVRQQGSQCHKGSFDKYFNVHHFGFVRKASRLREKWRAQLKANQARKNWFNLPGFVFNILPHKWEDPDILNDLAVYEGRVIRAVRENPDEFVRDGFALLKRL